MSGVASKFVKSYTSAFLKPFKAINKKIHESTGQTEMGGAVNNLPAGEKPQAGEFRQVGQMPGGPSGFRVNGK